MYWEKMRRSKKWRVKNNLSKIALQIFMNPYIRSFLKYFLQGVVIIGPLSTTVWIIWSIFYSVDNLVPHISERFPGLVFILVLGGTTLIGYLGNRFLVGKLLVEGLDYLLEHTPGVKFIYKTIRDVIGSFVGDKQKFSH